MKTPVLQTGCINSQAVPQGGACAQDRAGIRLRLMKTHLFSLAAIALCLAVSFNLRAADGDAEWQKVDQAIEHIKNPEKRPQSQDEAVELLTTGLKAFDEAHAEAMKAAPNHPARWDAALFGVMVAELRQRFGMAAPANALPGLEDIIQAGDAKPETRSQASVMDVMKSAEEAEASGEIEPWIAKAEKHLKAFPDERANPAIEGKIESLKAAVELQTKPLELKFTAVDGSEVDLAKLRGKVVLVDFWATWCGPCVAELPNVLKAYEALHKKGFEIVGISLDQDKAALESFVQERGMKWPQYFDGKGWQNEIASRYGIQSIPAMWLVNKKGMVVSTNARGGLEEKVAELLAE